MALPVRIFKTSLYGSVRGSSYGCEWSNPKPILLCWIMNCLHLTLLPRGINSPPSGYAMRVLKQIMTGDLPLRSTFADLLYCWYLFLLITLCLHCQLCVCVCVRWLVNSREEAVRQLVINASAIGFPHKERNCNSHSIPPQCPCSTPLLPLLWGPHQTSRYRSTDDPERCYRSI